MTGRPRRPRPAVGYLYVGLGAACFIVNAGVARVAIRGGVDTQTLSTARVTGAALVFVAWAAVADRSALRPPPRRLVPTLVAHGIVGVALLQWTYFVAIDRLPLGIALLLEYTAPVLVALWARFVRREPVDGRLWPALGLALAGLAVVGEVWDGLAFDAVGVAAALGAAVCFAAYFLIGEHGIAEHDPLRIILWSFAVAAVFLNVLWPLTRLDRSVLTGSMSLQGTLDDVTVPGWAPLVWIVVGGTVVPFALNLFALQHLPSTVVVVVAMVEPVGVAALGWAWFGEVLDPVQVVGGAAVIAGIVLAQSARRRPLPVAAAVT